MNRFRGLKLVAFGLVMLGISALPAVAADKALPMLPAYRLQVGQELVYKSRSTFKYDTGSFQNLDTWTFWVVRANPDHTHRVIVRYTTSFSQLRGNRTLAETVLSLAGLVDQDAGQKQVKLGWFDMAADGRIIDNPLLGHDIQPSSVLPSLPTTQTEIEQGWKVRMPVVDSTETFRLLPGSTAEQCNIEGQTDSVENSIYGVEQKRTITFDLTRGIPTKIATDLRQTYGFDGSGTGSIALSQIKTHPPEWCTTLAGEADKYFANAEKYSRTAKARDLTEPELKAALAEIDEELKQLTESLQSTVLKKFMHDQASVRATSEPHIIERLQERLAFIGAKSEDWQLPDLAGKEHALKDYRGRVVVLDFWYRGCGWCVRAMPQVKEIASHYKDQPVTVLGMNTDAKVENATFVVDKMGLNYVNLKAPDEPAKYKVTGFPTLLILDQQGVIRDVHVGYSPLLKDEVIRSIDRLLLAKP